ncbi:hypothetical protein LZ009_20455 [Ramlibacter sp. XY19]|uniref:hypothetical protein n=1 Tax=Ramlibacter paludis TaxID=2908000 RepID=UPI0023DB3076|nr:hypothetical protein [Ramlibacter paludis]MCG2595158.1 hypothetical protein [Ramlibacter paludis]
MRRVVVFAVLGTIYLSSHAAVCSGAAAGVKDYERAVKQVLALREIKAWRRTHPFPVSVVPEVDKKQMVGSRCYWSVTVYANRPERLELWNVFFVELNGRHMLVSDPNGDEVSLNQWRSGKGQ